MHAVSISKSASPSAVSQIHPPRCRTNPWIDNKLRQYCLKCVLSLK